MKRRLPILALFLLVMVSLAWVSDDAFLTLRTVDHAWSGHGLRWNIAERVQIYTHPLWMMLLLISHPLAGPWFGTMALGVLTSLAALALMRSETPWTAALLLLASKAFMDFTTSGLENPLVHLLLAAALLVPGHAPLWFALGVLARPDAALLFGPLLLLTASRKHWLGLLPLALWAAFATLYYGTPLPNTAFAKLGTGIPLDEKLLQGLRYLWHQVTHDPASLPLFLSLILARTRAHRLLAGGALLYTAYIVWIGGDFMGGRLLTPVLWIGALCLASSPRPWWPAALVLSLTLLLPTSPLRSLVHTQKAQPWHGIVDERGFYQAKTNPWHLLGGGALHPWAKKGQRARGSVVRASAGIFGYHASPEVHVIDPLGLGDPLLARLPARFDPTWRVGHYRRQIPDGYDPGREVGPTDPQLAPLWTTVRTVTRAPLFDLERLASLPAFQVPHSIWSARFPALPPLQPGIIAPEGAQVSPVPATLKLVPKDRWCAIILVEGHIVHDLDLTGGPLPIALPTPDGGTLRLYPCNRRHASQRVLAVGG